VKSAITPSFIGRMAVMCPGVRPSMFLASAPTATMILPPRSVLDGDDGGFVQDDALATDVDQRVGRAQVDGQVTGEIAAQLLNIEW
jgi:hypothetical protein